MVGSDPAVDLRLDHPTVSRRHVSLEPSAEGVWLKDLESSNGSRLDGMPLTQRTLVRAGQSIHLGSVACRLEELDPREVQAAVDFGLTTGPAESPTSGAAQRTLSVGSVREFLSSALPRVVAALERLRAAAPEGESAAVGSAPALALVQEAGQALYGSLPCRGVEVVGASGQTEPAILFRAGEGVDEGAAETSCLRAGRLETRIQFLPGVHHGSFLVLAELVTRLAALEWPPPAGTERPAPTAAVAVPLPQPATVDLRVARLYEEARRVARGEVGVLISGESGTGKEVLARFVHACSPRATGGWVALNCAALPEDLLEAELFGIERGVATGVEARPGKFEQADRGTLFLDEIGDMALATQAKILRVLQEGEVYRIGGRAARPARVRVISASNQALPAMVEAGDFRLDLYHRIADCRFTLPPLRERLADLPNLAATFLCQAAEELGIVVRGISQAALEALLAFPWPGNIRQLEREMARAALFLEDGELLQSRHLHREIAGPSSTGDFDPPTHALRSHLERFERGVIVEALLRNGRNVRATAEELEVGRTTLYRRMQELRIEV